MKTAAEVCAEIEKKKQNENELAINFYIDEAQRRGGSYTFGEYVYSGIVVGYYGLDNDVETKLVELGFKIETKEIEQTIVLQESVFKTHPEQRFLGILFRPAFEKFDRFIEIEKTVKLNKTTISACCGEEK